MANGNDKGDFPPGEGGASENGNNENVSLDAGRPAVAAAPGKMLIVLLCAAVFIFIVVRSLFFPGEKTPEKPKNPVKEQVASSTKNLPEFAPPPATLPSASVSELPPPPPPAPPAPPSPSVPQVNVQKGPTDQALQARIKSPMVISGSGFKSALSGSNPAKPAPASNDPNLAFAQAVANSDGAGRVEAANIGNLNYTIAQGKLIHAVLESAINSDLPSPIRAIVSHDIYAEAGKDILIPKGSRLIGEYNSQIRHGQARVYIIWTRVIRPDGIDVAIDSPGVDTLGRGGQGGDVDNKYFEMFSTAIMTSALDIGVAAAGQGLFGNQQQTTTSGPNGGSTTTSSPTATAMQQAVQNVGTMGQSIVGGTLNLQPTITVDQGTPVNVFVNHDLVFPARILHPSQFVE